MAGIEVTIGADTSGFDAGVNRTKKQLSQMGGEFRQGATEAAKWGAALVAAGAAAGAAIVNNSIQAAKELDNLSKVANTSRETFQAWAVGAKTVGIEQDRLADILKDVNDRVGDFLTTGGGPMADFFEQIAPKVGVTAEQFRNLSGPDALQLYVDSLQQANLSQQEMTFFMEAMASDATALIPLLRDGGAAMAEQAREAERLGLILSDIESEQILEASRAMTKAAEVAGSFADQLTAELAPIISATSRLMVQMAEDAGGVGEAASDSFNIIIDAAGFVADAVAGVARVFEVTGKTWAAVALEMQGKMLSVADTILNEPIVAVNKLVEALNQLPGIDIEPAGLTGLGESIREQLKIIEGATDLAWSDVEATLMRPLPSESFKRFVAEAKESSEAAAKEIVSIRDAVSASSGGGAAGGQATAEGGESDSDQQDALQRRIEQIRQANMSEVALLNEKFAMENEALNAAREQQLITEEEWFQLSREQKERQEGELTGLEQQAADARNRIAEQEAQFKRKALGDALSSLSTLMNSESKKMFEVGKAAALAQALVDGKAAIVGAYKVGASIGGPALGAAYGAAAGLATFQQIQAIRSASFGGGGSTGGSGGGSVTESINAQTQPVRTLEVSLQGFDPSKAYMGSGIGEVFDAIVDEAADRGLSIVVSR